MPFLPPNQQHQSTEASLTQLINTKEANKHTVILTMTSNEIFCRQAPQQPMAPITSEKNPTTRTVPAAAWIMALVPWSLATPMKWTTRSSARNQIPMTTSPSPASCNQKHTTINRQCGQTSISCRGWTHTMLCQLKSYQLLNNFAMKILR